MRIKISTLNSTLHESNGFSAENKLFIESIEKELNEKIELASIDDYDCDIKLIFIASGGSEGLFLKNINNLKEPFYLLTKGTNNSLAASLEIMTYLNINHLKGEILHGSSKYIGDRITNLGAHIDDNSDVTRLGVIGKPSDWLISSIPSYKDIKDKYNIDLIDIKLEEVINLYNELLYKERFNNIDPLGFDLDEVKKAECFALAIDKIVTKYNLKGFTIRCFDLLNTIKTTGCLALAKANAKGIIGTCEGDIMAMISMYLVRKIKGKSSFQANPSVIDVDNKEIVFAHCTLPLDMCESYSYLTHFESKIGVAIRGKMKKTKVGVFRLSSNLKDFYYDEGIILENLEEDNLCRTQIRVKMNNKIDNMLKNPTGNHHIIFYLD